MLKLTKNGTQIISIPQNLKRVFLSTTSTTTPKISTSMVNYLTTSLGFTEKEAIFTSSKVKYFKSTENPDFVINFLTLNGFNKTHIKKMVYLCPKVLSFDVETTLKPKLKAFQDFGFVGSCLADVVCACPDALRRSLDGHIVPTLEVLKTVFVDHLFLVRALKSSSWMLSYSVQKSLPVNYALLKSYGLSVDQIKLLFLRRNRYVLFDHVWLQGVLTRVEERIGIPRDSGMFFHGVCAFSSLSEKAVDAKFEFFKSVGWSELDVLTLVRKNPYTLTYSESRTRSRLHVWMVELGFQPHEIAQRACVLTYSYEKRIVPRHRIVKVLVEKKLITSKYCLFTCLYPRESVFFEKFVQPFKDEIPDLYDDFVKRMKVDDA